MQIDNAIHSEPTTSSPRRRQTLTVILATLGAFLALCLLQLACRNGVTTARGNGTAATSKTERRLIKVDGTARLDITPDRVDLHVTVTSQSKTPRAAAQAVQLKRKALLAAMKMLGLSDKHILTSHLNLTPRYERYNSAIVGYNGRITFVIKIQDPGELTRYVEAAAAAGASHLHTRFRHSRMQEMKRRVRTMALQAAKAKAEQIASVTGVQVGQVRSVGEGSHSNWMGSRWMGNTANYVANDRSTVSGSSAVTRPDAIPLFLSVNVSYAIR